jgi:ankyrin repeat protein
MAKRKPGKSAPFPVLDAVEAADITRLREAVAGGADIHGMEDISPLARAAELDNVEMVCALLELGHNPNLGGAITPLALAVRNRNAELVQMLLARGAQVDAPSEDEKTPLMHAASAGQFHIIHLLLAAGADLTRTDADGHDALETALAAGLREVVEFLLPYATADQQNSIQRRMQGMADPLIAAPALNEGADADEFDAGNSPLWLAVERNNVAAVRQLIAGGADVNETLTDGTTLLCLAAAMGHVSVVETLLAAGLDPNAVVRTTFNTPLHLAVERGRAESVAPLLRGGANVEGRNAMGWTPLMLAATGRDVKTIEALLAVGADPSAADPSGLTALSIARKFGLPAIAELLKKVGG